jgi:hypothetical protein
MQGIPLSLSLMAGFCVFVAAIYLFQVPSFVRAVREVRPQERPDPDIWRHVEQMSLAQAACLLANITPHGTNVVPPGDADGWYRALKGAVSSEEIPRIPMVWDHQNTTGGMYYPDAETVISRDSLRQFIKKRGVSRSVFSD